MSDSLLAVIKETCKNLLSLTFNMTLSEKSIIELFNALPLMVNVYFMNVSQDCAAVNILNHISATRTNIEQLAISGLFVVNESELMKSVGKFITKMGSALKGVQISGGSRQKLVMSLQPTDKEKILTCEFVGNDNSICTLLRVVPDLTELNLSFVTDEAALVDCIISVCSETLTSISTQYNHLSEQGLVRLLTACSKLTKVRADVDEPPHIAELRVRFPHVKFHYIETCYCDY